MYRIALIVVACIVATAAMVVIGGWLVIKSAMPPDSNVAVLKEALERQEIEIGDPENSWFALGSFPAVEYKMDAIDEQPAVGFTMFVESGEFVMLYSLDGKIVAAQYARGMIDDSVAKFYFIDDDAFSQVTTILNANQ